LEWVGLKKAAWRELKVQAPLTNMQLFFQPRFPEEMDELAACLKTTVLARRQLVQAAE